MKNLLNYFKKTDIYAVVKPAKTNGMFVIKYKGRELKFAGGPFQAADSSPITMGAFKVKVAEEQPGQADLTLMIPDFGVPTEEALVEAVAAGIDAAWAGRTVYVGCMGGIGRTGTYLATVLRVFAPDEDPISLVRRVYLGHAVETQAQRQLICKVDLDGIRAELKRRAFRSIFGR